MKVLLILLFPATWPSFWTSSQTSSRTLSIPKNLRTPNIIPDSTAVQTAIAIIPIICQPSIYIIEADICISIYIIYFHLLIYAKEEFIKYIDFNFSCSFVPCVLLRTISKVKSIYTISTFSENWHNLLQLLTNADWLFHVWSNPLLLWKNATAIKPQLPPPKWT